MSQDLPVEKLCHRCTQKPFRGHSLDGRISRGYLMERERCDDCRRQRFCCLFRPGVRCAGCGNHIHVEPAECRNDACASVYCIVCAPRSLRADGGGICVPCINRFARVPLAFFGEERRSA